MVFRFYTKQISQATRGIAATVFVVGMLLIGFAILIFALPELFAYLAAGVFFLIGLSVIGHAVRLFFIASGMDRNMTADPNQQGQPETYRKNVTIHTKTLDEE
jgi:multisubunit Na+/H+ antiporter MnhC subunit